MPITDINGNIIGDVSIKQPCRVATTGNITLTGLQTIDGVALNAGDRVLVWQQADATTNGIWAAQTGNWVRPNDSNGNTAFFNGTIVFVAGGTLYAGQAFVQTCADNPMVIGSSLITWALWTAVATAQLSATSGSSATISTGSMAFTVQAGKSFAPGQWLIISETSAPNANAMLAQVTSYSGTSLVVSVVATNGSGTHSDWSIALTNSIAALGQMPPVGTGNVTGPGSSVAGRLTTFADTTGKVLADSGLAAGTLAGRNQLLYGDAQNGSIPAVALAAGAGPLPCVLPQPYDNLVLLNDGNNPTRDINVTYGRVRDDTDAVNLQLAVTMFKRLDQAWAAGGIAGNPAGACDSGTKGVNQAWHVYLIGRTFQAVTQFSRVGGVVNLTIPGHGFGVGGTVRVIGVGIGFDGVWPISSVTGNALSYTAAGPDTGATACAGMADGFDILASLSYPGPAMPGGWGYKQCLGSVLTDGSANVRAFSQMGDEFLLAICGAPNQNPTVTSTAQFWQGWVPVGLKVIMRLRLSLPSSSGGGIRLLITSPDESDQDPNSYPWNAATSNGVNDGGDYLIRTNVVGQVRLRSSVGVTPTLGVVGWRDPRRRSF